LSLVAGPLDCCTRYRIRGCNVDIMKQRGSLLFLLACFAASRTAAKRLPFHVGSISSDGYHANHPCLISDPPPPPPPAAYSTRTTSAQCYVVWRLFILEGCHGVATTLLPLPAAASRPGICQHVAPLPRLRVVVSPTACLSGVYAARYQFALSMDRNASQAMSYAALTLPSRLLQNLAPPPANTSR
jgi:hypothetical protein